MALGHTVCGPAHSVGPGRGRWAMRDRKSPNRPRELGAGLNPTRPRLHGDGGHGAPSAIGAMAPVFWFTRKRPEANPPTVPDLIHSAMAS